MVTKENRSLCSQEEKMETSFCESNKNRTQESYETRRQYSSYCDDEKEDDGIHIKYTKIQYQQDCLKNKPFGDKDKEGFKNKLTMVQINSFFRVAEHWYSLRGISFNGFKTFTFRIKTIFKFYMEDDYLHLIMPMSFFIGLQDGFMARDFMNVSIFAHFRADLVAPPSEFRPQ